MVETHDTDVRVSRLETKMDALSAAMEHLGLAVERVSERLANAGRTDWRTLLVAAGLSVTILGAVIGSAVVPLAHLQTMQQTTIKEMTTLLGEHSAWVARLDERTKN